MSGTVQALAGVKVVEFGSYAAGPHVGKLLANFGATVVHVESRRRPDGFRLEYPPFKDGKPGINRGGCFAYFNDSKYGVTLDLQKEAGRELARRVLGWCDIVIENMRPGVMQRLGLGYASARALNPGLVMLSSCNMGQTGPRANTPGFGSQLSSLAGFCGLTGEPDGPPMLLYGPYIDFIASTLGAAAVLAALEQQRRTGQGAWIDLSQYETGLHFIAGALLDYHAEGTIADRRGNRCDEAAPHDAYACEEGRWLALSCWSDEEFARLASAIGRGQLSRDARFAGLGDRQANAAELDRAIAAWCQGQDADCAAALLQRAAVHAYPVNTIADLFRDPQLVRQRTWRTRRHGEIGDQAYCFPAFDLSATPGDITAAAPLLGADNQTVFREFIGLSDDEYATCEALGAFD
ncbi:MAG: CoA transferase [Burkholderiales bacterium]